MALLQTAVGGLASTNGVPLNLRSGGRGDLITSELHSRYYEAAFNKTIFSAANPTGITATAFVSGTTTVFLGLCLSNPIGSGVNLVINKVAYTCTVAPATESLVVLATGFNSGTNVTHTAPLTVKSNLIGSGAAGLGLVDSSFTVPTSPTTTYVLGNIGTGAATVSIVTPTFFDVEGSVILAPGAYAIVAALVASGASGAFASIAWEEVSNLG